MLIKWWTSKDAASRESGACEWANEQLLHPSTFRFFIISKKKKVTNYQIRIDTSMKLFFFWWTLRDFNLRYLIIPVLPEKTVTCWAGADFIQSCRCNKPFCITLSLVTRYFKGLLTVHKMQCSISSAQVRCALWEPRLGGGGGGGAAGSPTDVPGPQIRLRWKCCSAQFSKCNTLPNLPPDITRYPEEDTPTNQQQQRYAEIRGCILFSASAHCCWESRRRRQTVGGVNFKPLTSHRVHCSV